MPKPKALDIYGFYFNMNVFLYNMHDANKHTTDKYVDITSKSHRSDVMRCCSFFALFRRATIPGKALVNPGKGSLVTEDG